MSISFDQTRQSFEDDDGQRRSAVLSNGRAKPGVIRRVGMRVALSTLSTLAGDRALKANLLTATAAAQAIASGEITAESLIRDCLARVDEREPIVRAWASLDPPRALSEARERDRHFARNGAISPLHGIPVGIKDMIDTADLPTQHNSPIYRGHRPGQDAACVAVLRAAGAIILGKTETVEFAAGGRKAPTTNPHDRSRTPGGSSSGSAAAVADFQVPLAFGTQTGGSLIRPASFCGIFALKPSWGSVSREGAKLASLTFDTIGWYARSIADLATVAELFQVIEAPLPLAPADTLRIAICPSPVFEHAAAETRAALARGAEILSTAGACCETLHLDARFDGLADAHETIALAETRAAFLAEYRRAGHLLDDDFKAKVENRAGVTPQQLRDAYDLAGECRAAFDRIAAGYDAILTPAAVGEAPAGLASTGDHVFNRIWTLLHVPCVAVPGFLGPNGLPVGLQLVGRRFEDGRMLAVGGTVSQLFSDTTTRGG
jgi:Asp-tRNA(Asn)/Glu-tRNA(Gln) amidotransferase A subunit family amidase